VGRGELISQVCWSKTEGKRRRSPLTKKFSKTRAVAILGTVGVQKEGGQNGDTYRCDEAARPDGIARLISAVERKRAVRTSGQGHTGGRNYPTM